MTPILPDPTGAPTPPPPPGNSTTVQSPAKEGEAPAAAPAPQIISAPPIPPVANTPVTPNNPPQPPPPPQAPPPVKTTTIEAAVVTKPGYMHYFNIPMISSFTDFTKFKAVSPNWSLDAFIRIQIPSEFIIEFSEENPNLLGAALLTPDGASYLLGELAKITIKAVDVVGGIMT